MRGPNLSVYLKQLKYLYRPMTPAEEEIMRIYEDGIYRPPDITEKPGGLQIKRFGVRPGRRCSLQTALNGSVVVAAEEQDDLEARDAATYGAACHRTVVVVEVAKRQEEILLPIEQLFTNLWKSQQQGEATWIPEKWILIEYRVKTLL